MENEYKLHIGSYGWQYETWDNSFYPDDLPVDWQFSYYANEYSIVLIPWKLLQDDYEMLEQGINDSEESCRLLFEIAVDLNVDSNNLINQEITEIVTKISSFGNRVMGFVFAIDYSKLLNLNSDKIEFIKELVFICQQKGNICIDIQNVKYSDNLRETLPDNLITVLRNADIDLCNYNETTFSLTKETKSNLHVTFCNIENTNPRQMRQIVENSLIGECEGSTNVLIFRSENPKHEQMNSASVICDLL